MEKGRTCDGQVRQEFGYWSYVSRYTGGMNRLQASHWNVGEPQERYKGASGIKEASGSNTSGISRKERRTYGVPVGASGRSTATEVDVEYFFYKLNIL